MGVTFESFLTPAGLVIAAGILTGAIQLIKATFPALDARVSGAVMAFFLSLVLYAATGFAVPPHSPNDVLALVLAWLGCAEVSIGIKATADHYVATQQAPAPPPLLPTSTAK